MWLKAKAVKHFQNHTPQERKHKNAYNKYIISKTRNKGEFALSFSWDIN